MNKTMKVGKNRRVTLPSDFCKDGEMLEIEYLSPYTLKITRNNAKVFYAAFISTTKRFTNGKKSGYLVRTMNERGDLQTLELTSSQEEIVKKYHKYSNIRLIISNMNDKVTPEHIKKEFKKLADKDRANGYKFKAFVRVN